MDPLWWIKSRSTPSKEDHSSTPLSHSPLATTPRSSNVFTLPPASELRLESNFDIFIRVVPEQNARAEIFGFSVPTGTKISIKKLVHGSTFFTIFTWTGATIEIEGNITWSNVCSNRPMEEAFNANEILNYQRNMARDYLFSENFRNKLLNLNKLIKETCSGHYLNEKKTTKECPSTLHSLLVKFINEHILSNKQSIPRLLLLGPALTCQNNISDHPRSLLEAKSALSQCCCGWAKAEGHCPIFIQLDTNENSCGYIEALSFPPGIIGAVQLTELTTYGYAIGTRPSNNPNSSDPRSIKFCNTSMPSLEADGVIHSNNPTIFGRICFSIGITNRSNDFYKHQVRALHAAIMLRLINDIYSLMNHLEIQRNAFSHSNETDQIIKRIASGLIVECPSDTKDAFVQDLIDLFKINSVFVVENPNLLFRLCQTFNYQLPETRQENETYCPICIIGFKSVVVSEFKSKNISISDRWLDYFFGRLSSTMMLDRAPQIGSVSMIDRPLKCGTSLIHFKDIKFITLILNSCDKVMKSNEDSCSYRKISDIPYAEMKPFSDHPKSLLGRVLGIVSTSDVVWTPIRGFCCVVSIEESCNIQNDFTLKLLLPFCDEKNSEFLRTLLLTDMTVNVMNNNNFQEV